MKFINSIIPFLCVLALQLVQAEEIIPNAGQTKLLRGTLTQEGDIRVVSGEKDSTGHGPITYYQVPFREGTFSTFWKVEGEKSVTFVFDGAPQGKATHLLKVIVNGGPGPKSRPNHLTLITYDGSTREKKKAKVVRNKHYATPGEWHQINISISGDQATATIGGKEFKITSARFSEGIEKIGIAHSSGDLHTKQVKIFNAK
jgi:hypothetical protein